MRTRATSCARRSRTRSSSLSRTDPRPVATRCLERLAPLRWSLALRPHPFRLQLHTRRSSRGLPRVRAARTHSHRRTPLARSQQRRSRLRRSSEHLVPVRARVLSAQSPLARPRLTLLFTRHMRCAAPVRFRRATRPVQRRPLSCDARWTAAPSWSRTRSPPRVPLCRALLRAGAARAQATRPRRRRHSRRRPRRISRLPLPLPRPRPPPVSSTRTSTHPFGRHALHLRSSRLMPARVSKLVTLQARLTHPSALTTPPFTIWAPTLRYSRSPTYEYFAYAMDECSNRPLQLHIFPLQCTAAS